MGIIRVVSADYGKIMSNWIDKHSVNCYFCGDLVDERDCMNADEWNGYDGGSICPKCQKTVLPKNGNNISATTFQLKHKDSLGTKTTFSVGDNVITPVGNGVITVLDEATGNCKVELGKFKCMNCKKIKPEEQEVMFPYAFRICTGCADRLNGFEDEEVPESERLSML